MNDFSVFLTLAFQGIREHLEICNTRSWPANKYSKKNHNLDKSCSAKETSERKSKKEKRCAVIYSNLMKSYND